MGANRRNISFASFNLHNLQLDGRPTYPGAKPATADEYLAKVKWAAAAIHRLDADVIAFQELWCREALEAVFAEAGLSDEYALAFIKEGAWDGIAVAAAVRKPWTIENVTRHKRFPAGFRLAKGKRSMADIRANPTDADLADGAELLPSHEDDAISVEVAEFSRSPLQVTIRNPADDPAVPAVNVFCAHLKSKLATRLDQRDNADPAIGPHRDALGAALSAIRRLAEAAALRIILNGVMRDNDGPTVVLGDLNDGQYSNTVAILTDQPSFRVGALSTAAARNDDGLYPCVALQQLRSLGDVYYTHEFKNMREVLDHVLVSEQFYDHSSRRLWCFDGMRVLNDHLDEGAPEATDHGLVRARFRWAPRS